MVCLLTSIFQLNTSNIIKEAKLLTNKLFISGYEYQKIGVMLLNIADAKNEQYSFYKFEDYKKSDTVMDSLDSKWKVWDREPLSWGTRNS